MQEQKVIDPEGKEFKKWVEKIIRMCGGYWEEHPSFTVKHWIKAIKNESTRRAYWEWVAINHLTYIENFIVEIDT
ncbi:MAG: hypothetical protein AB9919_11195 [Geobacteraceae bacterium]